MEIHQLRYVLAVAETGNFTRAAARSFVAQPSLSQQIAKLEDELGHRLFHRLGRRAVPTDAGRIFIERARRILMEVDDAVKEMRDDPQVGRRITVGAIPTLAPYVFPVLLERCRQELPELHVQTREGFRSDLVEAVVRGDIDVAFTSLPLKDHRLSIEPAFAEPLLLAVGPQHRLAEQKTVTAGDLVEETFVMLGTGSTLATQIERFCGEYNFAPQIGHRCAQVRTLKALVALGQGVAILPQIARRPTDQGTLVFRELTGRSPYREVAVIQHVQRYQSRGTERFLTLARREMKKRWGSDTEERLGEDRIAPAE